MFASLFLQNMIASEAPSMKNRRLRCGLSALAAERWTYDRERSDRSTETKAGTIMMSTTASGGTLMSKL